jgi:hypothetical protein
MKKLAVLLAGASLFAPSCVDARPRTTTAPGVSIADVTCTESAGTCTLTITKERSKSYSIVTVTTVDGTANARHGLYRGQPELHARQHGHVQDLHNSDRQRQRVRADGTVHCRSQGRAQCDGAPFPGNRHDH